ncbi:hypothetical protein M8494_34585 (plasmid) [Serratia ureilytica]
MVLEQQADQLPDLLTHRLVRSCVKITGQANIPWIRRPLRFKTGDAIRHEVASDLAQRVAGIILVGMHWFQTLVRETCRMQWVYRTMTPGSLISNISNIQLSQAVDSASVNAGINDEKFTRMSDQKSDAYRISTKSIS